MGANATEMVFDADASKVQTEMAKLVASQQALEKSVQAAAKAAEVGANQAANALRNQGMAVKAVVGENERLRAEIGKLKNENMTAIQAVTSGWKMAGGALAAAGITSSLSSIISKQREWNLTIAESARLLDEQGRKMQVQTLQNDEVFQNQLRDKILPAAQKSATPLREALAAGAELVGQGFHVDQVANGSLEELLLGARGQAQIGNKEYATAVASWLKSRGQGLTRENVRGVTQPLTALFANTAFQAPDLKEMAAIGALTKDYNLSQSEAFAGVTALKDKGGMEAGEATTSMRNTLLRLGTASSDPERLDTLRAVGGEGFEKKVDFIGENLVQVLTNLKEKLDQLDPESRNTAMANIFGQKNIQGATTMMANIPAIVDYQNLQRDQGAFEKSVQIATQGPAATAVRTQNVLDFVKAQAGQKQARLKAERELIEASSIAGGQGAFMREMMMQGVDVLQWFGLTKGGAFDKTLDKYQGGVKPEALAGVPMDPVAVLPPMAAAVGPKRSIDFAGDGLRNDPLDKKIHAADVAAGQASLALATARVKFKQADSEGGANLTAGEKRQLAVLEATYDQQALMLQELRQQRKENPKKEVKRDLLNRPANLDG